MTCSRQYLGAIKCPSKIDSKNSPFKLPPVGSNHFIALLSLLVHVQYVPAEDNGVMQVQIGCQPRGNTEELIHFGTQCTVFT